MKNTVDLILKDMKDKINRAVKFREEYRPFAPVIPFKDLSKYMLNPEKVEIPYMEKAILWKKEVIEKFPAVVHADITGRVQTVTKKTNNNLLKLIREFELITNESILINTSFNINDEPVVNSPKDAIKTFNSSGIDVLSIGSFLIQK